MDNPTQAISPSIELEEIIPLGRSGEDYLQMFNLMNLHESRTLLDCAGGPSSFNAFMSASGKKVISLDPLYACSVEEIKEKCIKSLYGMIDQIERKKELFRWNRYTSIEAFSNARMNALQTFLSDFEQGKKENRYITGALPSLPFENNAFEIALCSHFLFLYSSLLTYEFHEQSILEMLRVAKEVRIYPLSDLNGKTSDHLRNLIKSLRQKSFHTQIINVPYEFQKGFSQCLIIRKPVITQ